MRRAIAASLPILRRTTPCLVITPTTTASQHCASTRSGAGDERGNAGPRAVSSAGINTRRRGVHRHSLRHRGHTSSAHNRTESTAQALGVCSNKTESLSAAVPRSLNTSAVEDLVDVERFFPRALAHLKAVPATESAAEASKARQWHETTHDYNADNVLTPAKQAERERRESGVHSFFDEGGLDVRGGMQEKLRQGGFGITQEESERASPDVLRLSGGSARRHGDLQLASGSNAAPADQTIEGDVGDRGADNEFGDTPTQITDMLRERLMELKAETLREERNETFLPQRLHHILPASGHVALLKLATRGEVNGSTQPRRAEVHKSTRGSGPATVATTLADLDPDDTDSVADWEMENRKVTAHDTSLPHDAAILRDGVAAGQVAKAAELVRGSEDLVPGAAGHDPLQRLAAMASRTGRRTARALPGGAQLKSSEGDPAAEGMVHLLRVLPRAGCCSRREATAIIASGQVRVNNVVERNPFRFVKAEDDIHVAGHHSRLRFAPPRLWMYHKPANVIVSRNDVAGRALITKHARILGMDHLVPVGSLPMRAHGILLLTNDGELSRFLENPKSNVQRTYLLRVRPAMDPVLVHKLNTEGIMINGRRHRDAEFFVNPATKSRYSVKVKVRGESMPIAHLMQHLGRKIERGGRLSFGPFALSNLAVGSLREVTVPPFYMEHLGASWRSFVERDWPYFRRQRVSRLRRLASFRELSPKELEELDNYTYEEVKDALSFESTELEAVAEQRARQLRSVHYLDEGELPLPREFDLGRGDAAGDIATDGELPYDDSIVEDITALL